MFRQNITPLAISRDGMEIAFMLRHRGTSQLYLRRMDRLEATPLKGTEDALYPFFSPDGQWVAFFVSGKLKKVSVLGGVPATLCDPPIPRGGTWASDDFIIFAPSTSGAGARAGSRRNTSTTYDTGFE